MKCKVIFFIGKGGVGKSTISSLYALSLSKQNKVVLVSLDSAHNLSDIFEVKFSDRPKRISKNLSIIEINVEKKIKEYLQEIENDLMKSNTSLTSFNLLDEFNLIKHSPGLEEYGLLKAYEDIVKQYSDLDYIIFDMPPTALTLKFFNLPARSLLWIEKLINLRERIKEKKEIVTRIKLGNKTIEKDRILEKLMLLQKAYTAVKENLQNINTEINLVVNKDKLSVNEGKNIVEQIRSFGFEVKKIVINRADDNFEPLNNFEHLQSTQVPISKTKLIGLDNLNKFVEKTERL